jgi:ABC-type xylose transport system permease subunit
MMLAMLLLMLMLSTMNLCFDICLDDDGNFHNEGHVDAGMSIMRIKTNTSMLVFVFLFYMLSDHARVKLHICIFMIFICMFSTVYVCRQGGRWLYILGGDHSCFEDHRSF